MDKIEAIVDALGHVNGMASPESDAYRLRNPILQRSFAKPGKHLIDDKGRRVFESLQAGYEAATFDVALKLSGHSRAGLKPDDCLHNLLGCYGLQHKLAQEKVVNWLRKSLQDQNVSLNTPLSYFLSKEQGN